MEGKGILNNEQGIMNVEVENILKLVFPRPSLSRLGIPSPEGWGNF